MGNHMNMGLAINRDPLQLLHDVALSLVKLVRVIPAGEHHQVIHEDVSTPLHRGCVSDSVQSVSRVNRSPVPVDPEPLLAPVEELLHLPDSFGERRRP